LEHYDQAAEEEQKVAGHLMRRLVQTDMLDDRAIEHRVTPGSHGSGDVIAAARTPGNALPVLLADGTGHSLAVSLSVTGLACSWRSRNAAATRPITVCCSGRA
jgi:hypothetical protein